VAKMAAAQLAADLCPDEARVRHNTQQVPANFKERKIIISKDANCTNLQQKV